MTKMELTIETLKLSLSDTEKRIVGPKDYLKYFKENFRMPYRKPNCLHVDVYRCDIDDLDIETFTDWLVELLIELKALPEKAKPMRTMEFVIACLDILQKTYRLHFDRQCVKAMYSIHNIATSAKNVCFTIDYLCMFISDEFASKKVNEFAAIDTEAMSTAELHNVYVQFLNSVIKSCLEEIDK